MLAREGGASTRGFVSQAEGAEPRAAIGARRRAFRALHERGCFVIPNPWDVGSARYLEHLGFRALATTSAGVAFCRGLPDSDGLTPYADVNTLFGAAFRRRQMRGM